MAGSFILPGLWGRIPDLLLNKIHTKQVSVRNFNTLKSIYFTVSLNRCVSNYDIHISFRSNPTQIAFNLSLSGS